MTGRLQMDQEDGLIWVYGSGDESVMAFTDFGIETLTGLVEIYKADPDLLKRKRCSGTTFRLAS